jgi:3-isopropylmalate/(R)-2-methylmalate dehydratase small subunit
VEGFRKHTGLVVPFDKLNVDTDQIVPKQFLMWSTKDGYGRVLFYDWRYLEDEKPNLDFVLNKPRYQGASILLCRANFACGSSREHAAWALKGFGFRVLLGTSYSDIFYSNCFKNSLLPVRLQEDQIDELFRRTEETDGYQLAVDLETQTIAEVNSNGQSGKTIRFEIDRFRRDCLLRGVDDIGLALEFERKIRDYEVRHHPNAPLFGPLTFPFTGR